MDALVSFLQQFFGDISVFLTALFEFLNHGLYEFFEKTFHQFIIYSTIAALKLQLFMLNFFWAVAKPLISSLNINSVINSTWGAIDSRLLNFASFFNIPQAINIILSARVTRFVLDFIGL